MQVVIFAICTAGESLRKAIDGDPTLGEYFLELQKKQLPGRKPGWLKLRSADKQRGAINVVWDG